jgi:hypothetical protein
MLAISVFATIADAIHNLAPGRPVRFDAPATPDRSVLVTLAQRPGPRKGRIETAGRRMLDPTAQAPAREPLLSQITKKFGAFAVATGRHAIGKRGLKPAPDAVLSLLRHKSENGELAASQARRGILAVHDRGR